MPLPSLPADYDAAAIRRKLETALDRAETYLRSAPADIVGLLAVDAGGVPVKISSAGQALELRRATSEAEVMPVFPETPEDWS